MSSIIRKALHLALAVAAVWLQLPPPVAAQEAAQPPGFKPEEIEQLVAPIALYPDPLLAQILMASTYPLEIVQAARWAKERPNLKDKALEDALQQQSWDPSVKSLTAFPQVLTMMSDQLDWTQNLGDAFLAQQKDVMDGVQRLRAKANAEGNLKTTPEQKVIVEQAAAPPVNVTVQQAPAPPPQIIKIEPANPQVVYVPTYNPTVVYGVWPYPAYPPYYYYPPGYVAATSIISFGIGMAAGYALWGNCNWGHHDVNVNINHYNNFNHTNISNNRWQHNVEHRKGVQYRDQSTRERYRGGQQARVESREAFRGRAEQGRQQLARGGGGRGSGSMRERPGGPGAGASARRPQAATRPARQQAASQSRQASSFQGMGHGNQVRRDSARGQASRQSARNFNSSGRGRSRSGGVHSGSGRGGGGGRRR